MMTLWDSNVGEGTISFSPTECHLLDDGRVVVVTYDDRRHGVNDKSEKSLLETMRPAWPLVFPNKAAWVKEWRPSDYHFTSPGWAECRELLAE